MSRDIDRRSRGSVRIVGLAVLTLASFTGCAGESQDQTTVVTADIRLTANDVRCLVLKAVGTTTVTQQTDVEGETSSTLTVSGIPVGSVTFTASAYSVKCASTGSNSATYVSDPITQTVAAGMPLNLVFTMRPASAMGTGAVVFDFPNVHGRTTEFPDLLPNGNFGIVAGVDGNMWFTMVNFGVGYISTDGVIQSNLPYAIPSPTAQDIAADTFGYVWFISSERNALVRMSAADTYAEFIIPTAGAAPKGLTAGPDGNMWFTENATNKIGKLSVLGTFTEYNIPTANAGAQKITAGPDGNLWFTEGLASKVAKITTGGTITEYATPSTTSLPVAIVAGADGNLWITETTKNKVAKVTTSGAFTEYTLPTANSYPNGMTRGPDGNLWAALNIGGVDKITPAGVITEYPFPDKFNPPNSIAAGPDGNLWMVSTTSNTITRMTP